MASKQSFAEWSNQRQKKENATVSGRTFAEFAAQKRQAQAAKEYAATVVPQSADYLNATNDISRMAREAQARASANPLMDLARETVFARTDSADYLSAIDAAAKNAQRDAQSRDAFRTTPYHMPENPTGWDYVAKTQKEATDAFGKTRVGLTIGGGIQSAGAGYANAPATINDYFNQNYAAPTVFNPDGTVNWEASVAAHKPSETVQAAVDRAQKRADDLQTGAAEQIAAAKDGLGWFGRTLVDAGVSGTQMAGDALLNFIVPGAGLTAMGVRSYGSAAGDARREGADVNQQMLYGLANAAVEVLSEKIGDIPGIYGGGWLDDVVKKVAHRWASNPLLYRAAMAAASGLGESIEEFAAGLIEPGLKSIYNGDGYFQNYTKEDWADMGNAMASAFLLGSIGGGLSPNTWNTQDIVDYQTPTLQDTQPTVQHEDEQAQPVEQAEPAQQPITQKLLRSVAEDPEQLAAHGIDAKGKSNSQIREEIRAALEEQQQEQARGQYGSMQTALPTEAEYDRLMKLAQEVAQERTEQPMTQRQALDMILDENANMGETGKKYARELFRLTQGENGNALDFYRSFDAVYQAARRGETAADVMSRYSDTLTPQAAQAAFNAGVEDMTANPQQQTAERYTYTVTPNDSGRFAVTVRDAQNGSEYSGGVYDTQEQARQVVNDFKKQMEGVTENVESGTENADGSARISGREERGGVRGRAETAAEWRASRQRAAEDIRNSVAAAKDGEEVSNREAGISGGTDEKSMRLVRNFRNDEMREIETDAAKKGVKVEFFLGEIRAMKGGKKIAARGEYSADGKTFYIALDDPDFTARQIYDHEDFHERSHSDAELQEAAASIIESHSAAELREMVQAYVNAYGWTDMSNEDIIQEILADAYAGIDIFMGRDVFEGATKFTEDVRGAVKAREGEQRTERGPPAEAKHSEKLTHDSDGRELTPETVENMQDIASETAEKIRSGKSAIRTEAKLSQKITPQQDADYAPTFYSKLEQEIEGFKADKIGAGSVVSYLRGRGVKGDEIKWSGIEDFLEGKKSVSKDELLNWLRDNRLEIETEILSDENGGVIEYTDEERQDLDVMHQEKEKLLDRSVELWNEAYGEAIPDRIILADKVDDAITLEIINRHGGRTGFDGYESLNKAERELWDKVADGIRRLDWRIDQIVDRAKARRENTSNTRWSQYSLSGGRNYREYMYKMPDSKYTNTAMRAHWNKRGVLAHARVQDFTSDGSPVLFVEEIQSDWHNEGAKKGYRDEAGIKSRENQINALNEETSGSENKQRLFDAIYNAADAIGRDYYSVRDAVFDPSGDPDMRLREKALASMTVDDREFVQRWVENVNATDVLVEEVDEMKKRTPDAPYAKTYHEFVLKNLLREAAENGFDYLAWTPGWMQEERWSSDYAEGYRIEYDQDIPKFLKKYGKQWGADVTEINLDALANVTVPAIEITPEMKESVLNVGQPMFSQKLTAEDELRRQNETLQKRVEYWQGQTKRTTVPTARAEDAAKMGRQVVKDYDSEADAKEIGAALEDLTDYIMRGENVTYAEVKDRAVTIARELVENAKTLREGDGETFREVRDALQKPLIISAQDAHDVTPDGWGDYRNSIRSKVNVSINGKGTPIDTAYQELSERFPSLFPEEITHPADQLQHMVDVIDELTPVYENPFSYNMAEAIEYAANDIIDRVFGDDIRMNPPTFADKAAAKLAAEKARGAERVAEVREQKNAQIADIKARNAWATAQRIAAVKKQRDAQLAALKEHYAEAKKTASEKKADSAARTRLLKIAKRLQNKKLPAVSRALLEQYIGNLDTVSKSITGKSIENLVALRDWYDDQKANNPDFIADDATEAKIARLSKMQISDMTPTQVAELTEVLLNFENEINTQRRMIDSEDKRDTRQMVLESLYNVEETNGSKKTAADWLVTNTLSPERLVKRLTGYAGTDPLLMRTQELSAGQRKMFDYQRRAEARFSKWANDRKLMERLRSKERVKITGFSHGRPVEVEITPDMRMALYLHSLNDENMKHIANGGVTIPDIGLYLKGEIGEAYSRGKTIKLSPSNIRSIAAGMSEEERAYAKAAHDYFNGMSKDEINAVSEKLVGYSIAGVDDYFPIETDKNFTKSDIAELKRDGTLEGMGFLKERQHASNAIYLVPLTDVLNKSIQNHAKYVGMAIPVRNFSKVWGMTAHNDVAGEENGLRQAIGQKWGERGIKAVERIISDVQNPSQSEDGKVLAKIRSNYAGAVLTLNASVALKQAASYPTAAAVLGWEPLIKAMGNFGAVNLDLINKYTPLQWYRSKGYSTQELGDIRSKGGVMDKVLSASIKTKSGREVPLLNWIQGIDLATTRKLWKASEYYVQQHNADLQRGSDAYYKAVADIYNRVIEETQPNYTTMQRPQILRSSNQLLQSLVMFKTQPFQNFNILYDAIGELRAAERAAKNGDSSRLTQAKKNAVNAVSSNLVSAVVFAAMTMAWAYARRKKDKYEDKEGNFNPWGQLGKDVLSSEFGMIPFGSDAYNLFASWVFGEKYYGMSNITADSISGALDATKKAVDTLSKTVNALLDGDETTIADPETVAKELFDCAKDLSKIAGVPLENTVNLVTVVYTNVASAVNGEYITGYEILRNTKNMDSSYNKSAAYDMLYKAMNQDMAQYNELRRMMIEDGFNEKNIDAAMKKRAEKK